MTMKTLHLFYVALLLLIVSCNMSSQKSEESDNQVKEDVIEAKIETFLTSYLNKKDETVLINILTDNYVRHINGITVASNLEELKAAMNIFYKGFPDLQITNESIYVKEGEAFVHFTFVGTNTGIFAEAAATGKKIKVKGLSHLYFNDEGKMYQEDIYYNELDFLQQLGYSLIPPNIK